MARPTSSAVNYQLRTRYELERIEALGLAPYAQLAGDSAGRLHPEPEHP